MVGNLSSKEMPFFFIIGRLRSGTTIIRSVLDAHPNIALPPESPLLLNIYDKFGKIKLWDRNTVSTLIGEIKKQKNISEWEIDYNKLENDLISLGDKLDFITAIKSIYLNYKSVFNKQKIVSIGDKNPSHSLYIEKIAEIFPEAKFVFIIRDYRDNILSILKLYNESPLIPVHAYRWKYVLKKYLKYSEKYPERFCFVRYEDFICQPEAELNRILAFLNLPFDSAVMNHSSMKNKAEQRLSVEFNQLWQSGKLYNTIDKSNTEKWKDEMLDKDIRIADLIAGKYAEIAGYKRKYKRFDIFISIKLQPVLLYTKYLTFERNLTELLFGTKAIQKGRKFRPLFPVIRSLYKCDKKYLNTQEKCRRK